MRYFVRFQKIASLKSAHAPARWLLSKNPPLKLIPVVAKTLEEFAEDVDETDASGLRAQIEKTEVLASGEDPGALEAAIEELSRLSYGLTEKLYAALGGMDGDETDAGSQE